MSRRSKPPNSMTNVVLPRSTRDDVASPRGPVVHAAKCITTQSWQAYISCINKVEDMIRHAKDMWDGGLLEHQEAKPCFSTAFPMFHAQSLEEMKWKVKESPKSP